MKRIFFITLLILIVFGAWQSCQAIELLIKNYPEIPGAQSPSKMQDLPNLINYIYKFALLACGLTAFVSILIGAIQYVTSAGDSSKAGDAKNRITSALWGILILLTSVLILGTINPDLVNLNFNLPTTTGGGGGTTNSKCLCCGYSAGMAHCDPTKTGTAITDPTYWPQTCKTIVPGQAEYDRCSHACYNVVCDSSAHRECYSQVVLCP